MLPLIPYKYLSINTYLSADDAVGLVSGHVSVPRSIFRRSRDETRKDYEGKVSLTGFRINRVIGYRNSFLPILYGRFVASENGTRINIHMTLHPFVIVFLAFWFLPFIGAFVAVAKDVITSAGRTNGTWLLPLGLAGFFYLPIFFAFGIEANKAEQFIRELFEEYAVIE